MTVLEKAEKLEEHCISRTCDDCILIGGRCIDARDNWKLYPEIVEKNYDIVFGNGHAGEESKCKNDMVNHPSHYTSGGVECIDAITAALSKYEDPVDSWLVGQVIKYLWRAPLKGKYDEDIKKAQFYLNRLVEKIDKKE